MTDDNIHYLERELAQTPSSAHVSEEARDPHRSGVWMMVLCLLMVAAVFFTLLSRPPAHWTGVWPLLVVLLCPLLHLLMHRGHGGH